MGVIFGSFVRGVGFSALSLAACCVMPNHASANDADAEFQKTSEAGEGEAYSDTSGQAAIGGSRIFLAAAVGTAQIDSTGESAGSKVYVGRSLVAGSAAMVQFAARPLARGSAAGMSSEVGSPLAAGIVTSRFGAIRADASGSRVHAGVDLAAPAGSQVTAARDGQVSMADWAGSYGLLVVIDHPDGLQSRYAHLSSVAVSPGQLIRRGEVLGLVGSTGRSTGPHLHFELRQDGRAVDPLSYFP